MEHLLCELHHISGRLVLELEPTPTPEDIVSFDCICLKSSVVHSKTKGPNTFSNTHKDMFNVYDYVFHSFNTKLLPACFSVLWRKFDSEQEPKMQQFFQNLKNYNQYYQYLQFLEKQPWFHTLLIHKVLNRTVKCKILLILDFQLALGQSLK